MKLLLQMLIWWRGQSVGTRIFTWRNGELVGTDAEGNKYYQSSKGKRWVVFHGEIEASKIPASWHGWLHNTFDECPGETPLKHKIWEKPHVENLSATGNAYRPEGSIFAATPKAARDYEAWQPE